MRNRVPKDYVWEVQWAGRRSKKGRAMGEMLMGVRKRVKVERDSMRKEKEGIITGKVWLEGDL